MTAQAGPAAREELLIVALLENAELRELCLQALAPRPPIAVATSAGSTR